MNWCLVLLGTVSEINCQFECDISFSFTIQLENESAKSHKELSAGSDIHICDLRNINIENIPVFVGLTAGEIWLCVFNGRFLDKFDMFG